jgi:hypothetical protein
MDKERGFAGELQTLKADVETDVGRYVELLRREDTPEGDPRRHFTMSQGNGAKPDSPDRSTHRRVARRPRNRAEPSKSAELQSNVSRGPLVNVTTRLTAATNQRLTEAALRQRLATKRPDSRQEIVEEAVVRWLAENGYSV